ncbi:MAG: type II toxin-antitoxin system antitoxin, RelB/DinJ family [Legionellales bacterium]|nr:type II toxin-antitoxin system antitoxin, RelB/DinJ family [Legionellales bacterium]
MTANAVVRARINEQTKQEAAAVLAAMGLTVSDAFRMLLVRIAKEKALPFEPLCPNDETIAAIKAARDGKLTSVDSVDTLLENLDEED